MKIFTTFKLSCLFFLLHSMSFADNVSQSKMESMEFSYNSSHFGSAGFSVTDPNLWYTITTNSYPEMTALSLDRNKGISEGRVYLSPTGFTIGEAGNYWVEISAVLSNTTPDSTILVPIFLALDEVIVPDGNELIGGVVTLPTDDIKTVYGAGILKNVAEGVRLSIVATNGGYPSPQDIVVAAWNITLFKI